MPKMGLTRSTAAQVSIFNPAGMTTTLSMAALILQLTITLVTKVIRFLLVPAMIQRMELQAQTTSMAVWAMTS